MGHPGPARIRLLCQKVIRGPKKDVIAWEMEEWERSVRESQRQKSIQGVRAVPDRSDEL
jgi:hypothetical protein